MTPGANPAEILIDLFNRALTAQQEGHYAQAVSFYEALHRVAPHIAESHINLGHAYNSLGRRKAALAEMETALRLAPDLPNAYSNLVLLLTQMGQRDYAESLAWQQLERWPDDLDSYINIGAALAGNQRFEAAWQICRRAPAEAAESAQFQRNLGRILAGLGARGGVPAIAAFRRAIALDPAEKLSHLGLADCLLRIGDYPEGWSEYRHVLQPLLLAKPEWEGEDLTGKQLLVHKDAGFGGGAGDVIHLARYVRMLASAPIEIRFCVPPSLRDLFWDFPANVHIQSDDRGFDEIDYHISLMGLPRVLGSTLETIPRAIPYLTAEPGRVAFWRERLAGLAGRKVGLIWAGQQYRNEFGFEQPDPRRLPFPDYQRLLRLDGIDIVPIQLGEARREIAALPPGCHLHDWTDAIRDFADSAALMECLDLIISVDTSTAHLAGALGRPVWVMLSSPCCWRWMYDRADSPWYPTARLFRQKATGAWSETIDRVADALQTS